MKSQKPDALHQFGLSLGVECVSDIRLRSDTRCQRTSTTAQQGWFAIAETDHAAACIPEARRGLSSESCVSAGLLVR